MGWGVLWLLLKHRRVVWLSISVMVSWRRDSDIQLIQFVRLIKLLAKQAWLCCIYVDINNITNIISTETTNGNRQSLLDANNNKPCKIVGWTNKKKGMEEILRDTVHPPACYIMHLLCLQNRLFPGLMEFQCSLHWRLWGHAGSRFVQNNIHNWSQTALVSTPE